MLHNFIVEYRDSIIQRTRDKMAARPWPTTTSTGELENGVSLFLTQLANTLRDRMDDIREVNGLGFAQTSIGVSAARHGGDLLELGFTLSEVVHDYGDICQAVTELALEKKAVISIEEFHTLNQCLDDAIAQAVTEHSRIKSARASLEETERMGYVTHQIRDLLNTAIMAYQILKQGAVSVNGTTGAVLGSSLVGLRDFIDTQMSEVRLLNPVRERIHLADILKEVTGAAALHAELRVVDFVIRPVNYDCQVMVDTQLLQSAIMNLLNNAFKFTPSGGRVVLRTYTEKGNLVIEIEDECGGLTQGEGVDMFQAFQQRRGTNRTGLGLGLSIARKAVAAHNGSISTRNIPTVGCVFSIKVPLAGAIEVAAT